MIYELRTYTVKPGTLGDMIKAAGTVSRDIRKDDYGKLEGYWSTEIGPLNQVLHMWSYNSFDERARMRAELAKNPRWTGEYVPLIRPLLVRQDVRLMNAVRPPVASVTLVRSSSANAVTVGTSRSSSCASARSTNASSRLSGSTSGETARSSPITIPLASRYAWNRPVRNAACGHRDRASRVDIADRTPYLRAS